MKYSKVTLSNGLRVICVPVSSLESATVTVWVKTGSRKEDKRVNGISHFLEHMVFKGSKKRPSSKLISEAVDGLGREFNAGTTKEWTNFYIRAEKGNLDKAFDVLSDMVLNPVLDPKEIEREKGVIAEEIAMYEDTPIMKIGDVFETTIFGNTPLGWEIAGDEKSVRSIKKDDFVLYRNMHYYSDNIIVTVAGGITEKEVVTLAKKYFSGLKTKPQKITKTEKFVSKQDKPQIAVTNKDNEQAHFILGFLGNPRAHKDRYTEGVLAAIMGGGMSSRLFTEIRERRGLAYSVRTFSEHFVDTGYFATYAGVDPKKLNEAVKVALDQHWGLVEGRYPISEKELKKAKELIKGHIALALEDTREINNFYGDQILFDKKVDSPEDIFKAVDKVTVKDILVLAKKFFVPSRLNFAVIGKGIDKKEFEKLLK